MLNVYRGHDDYYIEDACVLPGPLVLEKVRASAAVNTFVLVRPCRGAPPSSAVR